MLADAPPGTIVCSHGDLIPAIVETLAGDGLSLAGEAGWRKGSTWILDRDDGRFVRARYLPPPDETDERASGGSGTWTDAPAG
jgi:hypothetical protein